VNHRIVNKPFIMKGNLADSLAKSTDDFVRNKVYYRQFIIAPSAILSVIGVLTDKFSNNISFSVRDISLP
jgi:hypothetical protein